MFYHYDGLGSTRHLSDDLGSLTDSYDYEAFGEVLAETGSTENRYQYTGEQFDASLSQYYLRARYYDQGVGRFTQMDTWAGVNAQPITLNKYLYANADPVFFTDPSGFRSLGELGAANQIQSNLTVIRVGTVSRGFAANDGAIAAATSSATLSSKQAGLLVLASMGAAGLKLYEMSQANDDENRRRRRDVTLYHGASSNRASKIVTNGFSVSNGEVFFAESFADARFFATQQPIRLPNTARRRNNIVQTPPQSFSVITFKIPENLANSLGIGNAHRSPIGLDRDMSHVQMSITGGFERILRGSGKIMTFNGAMKTGQIKFFRTRI